jgi:hypothetical protein
MYLAVRITLCSALQSDAKQLPYHAEMQPVRMLCAAVELFKDLGTHAKTFQSTERKKMLLHPLHDCLDVFGP